MTPNISWSAIWPIISLLICSVGGAWLLVYKLLQRHTSERLKEINQKLEAQAMIAEKYFAAHEKIRDRWEEFLKDYIQIDSTRGNKIDALFRVVDQMQETFRELRPALNTKVEDSFQRALSELKVYVRDQIREEKHE